MPSQPISWAQLGQSLCVLAAVNLTTFLIGAAAFDALKPTAFVVNVARGPIVDQRALVEALQAGRIAGAALDVYEDEPLPPDSPLLRMDNVLLAPHNANSSPAAWERVHWNTIRNLFLGLGLAVPPEAEEHTRS